LLSNRAESRAKGARRLDSAEALRGVDSSMTITADIFEAFLNCPTKCYLRSLGEVGTGNAYAGWLCIQNESWRRERVKCLTAGTAPGEYVGSPSATTSRNPASTRSNASQQEDEARLCGLSRFVSSPPTRLVGTSRWFLSAGLVEQPHIANNHKRVLGPANRNVKHVTAYVESRRAIIFDGCSSPGG
jgi:hypothetical protein